jgi:hypothetical protein
VVEMLVIIVHVVEGPRYQDGILTRSAERTFWTFGQTKVYEAKERISVASTIGLWRAGLPVGSIVLEAHAGQFVAWSVRPRLEYWLLIVFDFLIFRPSTGLLDSPWLLFFWASHLLANGMLSITKEARHNIQITLNDSELLLGMFLQ